MTDSAIAIVIPHYQDHVRLIRCLDALLPQIDASSEIEIVVADNNSPETLADVQALHPRLRVVTEPRKGAARARNRGVAETKAERIFFLDCDCVPAPDWVENARGMAGLADLVGGAVGVFDETPPPRSGAEAFEAVFAFDNRGYVEKKGFSVTANLLTTRAVFDKIGGFRQGLSEDLDWCRRATEAGFTLVYSENLRVSHPSRSNWSALKRKWRRLTDEAWGLEERNIGSRSRWALRALAMPISTLVHLPRVLRHDTLAVSEKTAGIITMSRLRVLRMVWMLTQAIRG